MTEAFFPFLFPDMDLIFGRRMPVSMQPSGYLAIGFVGLSINNVPVQFLSVQLWQEAIRVGLVQPSDEPELQEGQAYDLDELKALLANILEHMEKPPADENLIFSNIDRLGVVWIAKHRYGYQILLPSEYGALNSQP